MNKRVLRKLFRLLENTGDMALKRRARRIVEELGPKEGDIILDVGTGDGYYLHLLSNLRVELKLTGVDNDVAGLKRARKILKREISLKTGDLMKKLPFKNNSFDKIVMSEVAEHLPNDIKGLKEVYRVLKPAGILCLTVPNANYPFLWDPINWIFEHFFGRHIKHGFWAGIWNQHERLYNPDEIKKVVRKAGFRVEKIKSLTWWCLPFNHYIVNLVARGIASGAFSGGTSAALSKYAKVPNRSFYLNIAFKFVNYIDRLNDYYQPQNSGVAVFVKAKK